MALQDLTDENFEKEVLKSGKNSLIQFSATWCNPCKMLKPIISELSDEMSDKLKFFYMDIDSQPNVPTRFGIRGVPTLILFDKNGQVKSQKVGATTKANVSSWLRDNLSI
jgi:thioredoxin 1|tara:strand:- start:193 stop:522 length:330 start_codon:yes stop_codon:yes gene_type:complete